MPSCAPRCCRHSTGTPCGNTAHRSSCSAVVAVRVPSSWAEVFSAIRGGRWTEAQAGISALPQDILTPVARAELYTAKGSPVVSPVRSRRCSPKRPTFPRPSSLREWRLRAARRLPLICARRPIAWLGNSPSRNKAKAVGGEPAADQLRSQLDPLIKADDAVNAELLLMQASPSSPTRRGRKPGSASPGPISRSAVMQMRAVSPIRIVKARPATGQARPHGFRAWRRGG